ncbi:MAG: hypothetical protein ACTSQG_01800, partial [Promethearchaeota archaeon]
MAKKIKLLLIFDYPENDDQIKGGVCSAVLNLISGLSLFEEDIKVLILSKSNRNISKKLFSNILLKYKYPKYRILNYIKILDIIINRNKIIKNEIKNFKPDIIHINTTGPFLLSLIGLPKRNIVITQHGVISEELKLQNSIISKL